MIKNLITHIVDSILYDRVLRIIDEPRFLYKFYVTDEF